MSRYLTKIADQIVALVPDEYSDSLIFAEEAPAEPAFDMDDGVDRLFTFEVKKTREEEENVIAMDGFKVPLNSPRSRMRLTGSSRSHTFPSTLPVCQMKLLSPLIGCVPVLCPARPALV